ncbi:MAG: maleylacetate reductase [Candidatus Nanopelagicales bacterium]
MVAPFVHDVPASRVVFANGSLARVADELERLNCRRTVLVAGGPEAVYADIVAELLGPTVVARFSDVVMHVPIAVAQQVVDVARTSEADSVIAVGGGSSIGAAKAVAKEMGLPILAIPTTYAGSEMTPIWGLTEGNRKTTGRDPKVLPRTVLYDPELTVSLPPAISAASGMNALAHLVEGLYAPGLSPISALQAEEGVRALASALPRVVEDPADLSARGDALYGAWLAGWTLGTTGMGVHHKICHTLGGAFDLPHAPTHSAVLPYATAFNEAAAPEAMAAITRALAAAGMSDESAAAGLWRLADRIGAPTSLKEVGFTPSMVDEAAEIVVAAQPINPRPVDLDGTRALLLAAYDGTKPGAWE